MILKADLHLHSSEDPVDPVSYTSYQLIDRASELGFHVLAITNHEAVTYSAELRDYAADRGILLIPGIEKAICRRHVLILNADSSDYRIRTFDDLRAARADGKFIIAPHPFFRARNCLGKELLKHIDLFDGIEHTFLYSRWLNLNRRAARVAEKYGLPLVGNSDSHVLTHLGRCHSVIEAEEMEIESVFTALRQRQVQVMAQPFGPLEMFRVYAQIGQQMRAEGRKRRKGQPGYALPPRRRRRPRLAGALVHLLGRI